MKLIGIKVPNGVFIKHDKNGQYDCIELKGYFFDGEHPQETFKMFWYLIKDEPKLIQKEVSQPSINWRYELVDASLESEKFPLVFKREDCCVLYQYDWVWKPEYSHLASLYSLKWDTQPNILETVPFEFKIRNMIV